MGYIFLVLFAIFFAAWIVIWAVLHVVGGAIHILLVLAVLFLITHFVRRLWRAI